jgi:hypothetical protein
MVLRVTKEWAAILPKHVMFALSPAGTTTKVGEHITRTGSEICLAARTHLVQASSANNSVQRSRRWMQGAPGLTEGPGSLQDSYEAA